MESTSEVREDGDQPIPMMRFATLELGDPLLDLGQYFLEAWLARVI